MSSEARFLAERTADLLVATSRLQTASKEAVYPHFLCSFQADIQGLGYIVRDCNRNYNTFSGILFLTFSKRNAIGKHVSRRFHGTFHETFLHR